MKFIKDRLNKDNFWNLMFFLGMTFGISIAESFDSLVLLGINLFVLPKILTMFNKVTYTNDKIFINKQGLFLTNKLPKALAKIFFLSILITALVFVPSLVSTRFIAPDSIFSAIVTFVLFITVSYFIIINCPISILFNKNAWLEKIFGFDVHVKHIHNFNSSMVNHKSHSSLSPNDWSTSPAYKNLSSNIHYKR